MCLCLFRLKLSFVTFEIFRDFRGEKKFKISKAHGFVVQKIPKFRVLKKKDHATLTAYAIIQNSKLKIRNSA